MPALPSKSTLDGTKVPATKVSEMKTAMAGLYDYLAGLFNSTGTIADARAQLQAAKSGANTDITSLAGITGILGWVRGAGAGKTYTQATNKQTAVPVTTKTGVITMNNAALAANAKATFLISYTGATNDDIATVGIRGGITNEQNYNIIWRATGSGIQVILWNTSGGSLSEAVEVIYGIFQGAAT